MSLNKRYQYEILVCLGGVQVLLVMSSECANRSKDAATSCCHHQLRPNQGTVQNIRPPVK